MWFRGCDMQVFLKFTKECVGKLVIATRHVQHYCPPDMASDFALAPWCCFMLETCMRHDQKVLGLTF
jgi:hypothetical protein